MSLKSRNAIVTGSTSGIGLAIARAFAKEGANVVINGFGDAAAIEKERAGIAQEFGVTCIYSPANMLKPDEIASMVHDAETKLGSVDLVVNNAGIQFVSPIEEFPLEKWDQIIGINLSSAFHTIRSAFPGMKKRKWGRIINTASAHSKVASPFKSAYVSAKHGLDGLTKTAALEGATFGITVNCVSPGYVWTPLVEHQIPETMAASAKLPHARSLDVGVFEATGHRHFVVGDRDEAIARQIAAAGIADENQRPTLMQRCEPIVHTLGHVALVGYVARHHDLPALVVIDEVLAAYRDRYTVSGGVDLHRGKGERINVAGFDGRACHGKRNRHQTRA
jgi:3-hydroxybutyrate dehydrogenase